MPRVSSFCARLESEVMSGWHSRCWTLPRMERLPDCGDACGPNGDDPDRQPPRSAKPGRLAAHRKARNGAAERSIDEAGRSGPRPSAAPPLLEADPAVEQLKQLLLAEAGRFRQNTSVSMSVVICVGEQTELLVHF